MINNKKARVFIAIMLLLTLMVSIMIPVYAVWVKGDGSNGEEYDKARAEYAEDLVKLYDIDLDDLAAKHGIDKNDLTSEQIIEAAKEAYAALWAQYKEDLEQYKEDLEQYEEDLIVYNKAKEELDELDDDYKKLHVAFTEMMEAYTAWLAGGSSAPYTTAKTEYETLLAAYEIKAKAFSDKYEPILTEPYVPGGGGSGGSSGSTPSDGMRLYDGGVIITLTYGIAKDEVTYVNNPDKVNPNKILSDFEKAGGTDIPNNTTSLPGGVYKLADGIYFRCEGSDSYIIVDDTAFMGVLTFAFRHGNNWGGELEVVLVQAGIYNLQIGNPSEILFGKYTTDEKPIGLPFDLPKLKGLEKPTKPPKPDKFPEFKYTPIWAYAIKKEVKGPKDKKFSDVAEVRKDDKGLVTYKVTITAKSDSYHGDKTRPGLDSWTDTYLDEIQEIEEKDWKYRGNNTFTYTTTYTIPVSEFGKLGLHENTAYIGNENDSAALIVKNNYTSITFIKKWDDDGSLDRKMGVTISGGKVYNLKISENTKKSDGLDVRVTVSQDDPNAWSVTISGLPKYDKDGKEIDYSISKEAAKGYTSSQKGNVITNRQNPKEAVIDITKLVTIDNQYLECTNDERVLICGKEEHEHDDDCYPVYAVEEGVDCDCDDCVNAEEDIACECDHTSCAYVAAVEAKDGCELDEHIHDASCWNLVKGLDYNVKSATFTFEARAVGRGSHWKSDPVDITIDFVKDADGNVTKTGAQTITVPTSVFERNGAVIRITEIDLPKGWTWTNHAQIVLIDKFGNVTYTGKSADATFKNTYGPDEKDPFEIEIVKYTYDMRSEDPDSPVNVLDASATFEIYIAGKLYATETISNFTSGEGSIPIDLPKGVDASMVTVKEVSATSNIKYVKGDLDETKSNEDGVYIFDNYYMEDKTPEIVINKTVDATNNPYNRDISRTFTFELYEEDDKVDEKTITDNGTEKFFLSDYENADAVLTLYEVDDSTEGDGWTYDDRVYTITIVNGEVVDFFYIIGEGEPVPAKTADFKNIFAEYATPEIEIVKTVVVSEGSLNPNEMPTFEFKLDDNTYDTGTMGTIGSITIDVDEDDLTAYTNATAILTLWENRDSVPEGWTYDDTVYTIRIVNGQIVGDSIFEFVNTYENIPPPTTQPPPEPTTTTEAPSIPEIIIETTTEEIIETTTEEIIETTTRIYSFEERTNEPITTPVTEPPTTPQVPVTITTEPTIEEATEPATEPAIEVEEPTEPATEAPTTAEETTEGEVVEIESEEEEVEEVTVPLVEVIFPDEPTEAEVIEEAQEEVVEATVPLADVEIVEEPAKENPQTGNALAAIFGLIAILGTGALGYRYAKKRAGK